MRLNPKSEYRNPKQCSPASNVNKRGGIPLSDKNNERENFQNPNDHPAPFYIYFFKNLEYLKGAGRISDFVLRIFTSLFLIFYLSVASFAQDNDKLLTLSKRIIEAKAGEDLYVSFEELKDLYFADNKYSEFVDFLKSLSEKKKTLEPFVNYYIALTRYYQLKYLEDKQLWDEYFAQGNTYRDEISTCAKNAIEATGQNDTIHTYARLILWQFHRDQQDTLSESSLTGLMDSVLAYSQSAQDLKPIKEVADKLSVYTEKTKSSQLYKIYVDKLLGSNIKDEALAQTALGFYKEGGLELAENIYDAYVDKISKSLPKEKLIPILVDIAKLFAPLESFFVAGRGSLTGFAYKSEGAFDMPYAEKIFAKIQELGGIEAFNQELIYLRAFNLEKAKEFSKAKDIYLDLLKHFPNSPYVEEADFKVGIIYTYILRDIKSGRLYFEELAKKETSSAQVISSLYQLGLLSQWESDFIKAKEYYNKLTERAKSEFQDSLSLAKERLKEIEENQPIEYNLRRFLDASLKEEYTAYDMSKLDLKARPYKVNKGQELSIDSTVYTEASGCMQIQLEYLWSGHTGKTKPSIDQQAFNTSYESSGIKEINLVVVSPSGIIDRSIDLVDVN